MRRPRDTAAHAGVPPCALAAAQKFDALEAESYAELNRRIAAAAFVPASVYNALLNKIYKRSK